MEDIAIEDMYTDYLKQTPKIEHRYLKLSLLPAGLTNYL
jgi:hypothetical protein